ncbi:MAG TPA: hypothetical protein VI356_24485 [Myxococcales bacterium]
MITPRLLRRSLRRGLQWRLLLLWWASLLVPSSLVALPAFAFFREKLDHSTGAAWNVASLEGSTLIELLRQLRQPGPSLALGWGAASAVVCLLAVSPFVAGATVAAARSDGSLRLGALMAGGGELYGRMLRTLLAGLVPIGLGSAAAAGIGKVAARASERATTETAAQRNLVVASVCAAAVLFVVHLVVEAARAQFAADPGRRSAVLALWSGARLLLRRPARAFAVGAVGALAGVGGALILMTLRLQLVQSGATSIALAWLLAQAAQVAVGWGRATRIFGLAELSRADAAARAGTGPRVAPGVSPGVQVVHSATLSALEPPRSGASR